MQVKSTRLQETTWKKVARRHVTDCGGDWNITRKWLEWKSRCHKSQLQINGKRL